MNPFMVDSRAKPVNPLLGALDERFGWDASKKLQRARVPRTDRPGSVTALGLLLRTSGQPHYLTSSPAQTPGSPAASESL